MVNIHALKVMFMFLYMLFEKCKTCFANAKWEADIVRGNLKYEEFKESST